MLLPKPRPAGEVKKIIRDADIFELLGGICLFSCAVYRAVHLELATGLSTPTFLMASKSFIARRRSLSFIYSDYGSNFEGLHNCLQLVDYKKLAQTLLMK